jgi:methylamine dehydrogenase heavy chain
LKPKGQIVIPTQTAESASNIGYSALLDGNRLLGLFNQFPTQSVSIVDLEARTFVDSIPTGGCAGVYATGPRSFASICGDGTIRRVELDARGNLAKEDSTGVFFESVDDPIMMKGARLGSRWYFISFAGVIHEVDFSQSPPTTHAWSGVNDAEKATGWRPGGRQLTAIHRELSRLYVSFHQGEPGSHKAPGPEVWVFDLNTRQRVSRFELPNSDATAVAGLTGLAGGFSGWLLQKIIPSTGGDTLVVTQDSEPLLLVRNSALPVLAVLDAQSGAHMRDILEIGFSGNRLTVPR